MRGSIEYITIFMIRVNIQVHTRFSRACSPDEVMSIRKKIGRWRSFNEGCVPKPLYYQIVS
jgi:hypothetical protein